MNEVYQANALEFQPTYDEQGAFPAPDGGIRFVLRAKDAHSVQIKTFTRAYPLQKADSGAWTGDIALPRGFQYLFVEIDGADVLSPHLPIGYGCKRAMNFVDVPSPGEEFYEIKRVPHGRVTQECFYSNATRAFARMLVYTPPGYFDEPDRRYPILYLQHGHGENETGWTHQGKMNFILDNLIAEGKCKEMIVVMLNGMTYLNGKLNPALLLPMLCDDALPFAEKLYRALPGRENRAVAGLSMGSWQACKLAFTRPELFAYAGLFSGFMRDVFGSPNVHLAYLDDKARFKADTRLFYRAMGAQDGFIKRFLEDDEILAEKGIESTRVIFEGEHEWQVWRRCLRDFAPRLFY